MHRTKSFYKVLVALMIIGIFAINTASIAGEPLKVNLNTATKEQLMTLSGIGEKVAANMIAYRDNNGPFKTPEDIMKVKGIGSKTFARNKDRIFVKMSDLSMKKK